MFSFYFHETTWERYRFCEQRYYQFAEYINDQYKSYRSYGVIQLYSLKLFHLNSFTVLKCALKIFFIEYKKTLNKDTLWRVFFWHSSKTLCAKCFFFTWQKVSLLCVFLHSAKSVFAENFFTSDKENFQTIFWSRKWIQMKKFWTTKFMHSTKW